MYIYIYICNYIPIFSYINIYILYKVASEFQRQDSQSSYSSGKTQIVGETELSEENN